jgi:hypothetical protein
MSKRIKNGLSARLMAVSFVLQFLSFAAIASDRRPLDTTILIEMPRLLTIRLKSSEKVFNISDTLRLTIYFAKDGTAHAQTGETLGDIAIPAGIETQQHTVFGSMTQITIRGNLPQFELIFENDDEFIKKIKQAATWNLKIDSNGCKVLNSKMHMNLTDENFEFVEKMAGTSSCGITSGRQFVRP